MRISFIVKPFQVELLGIAYLAAVLKQRGHVVTLVKVGPYMKDELNLVQPNILAYTATTGQHQFYLDLNRKIKNDWQISILGGPHATYFPEVIYEKGLNAVFRGEAEISILNFVHKIEMNKNKLEVEKEVIQPGPLETTLDNIPLPDRPFLYTYIENYNNPIKNVMTSRGCPFNCPYCYNSLYRKLYHKLEPDKPWVRFRSPHNVLEEVIHLQENYPLKMIFFQDDEFLANPELEHLLLRYKQLGKVPFHCQIRIELLNEAKVKLLKEAGCYSVTFAIESGDYLVRKNMLNRRITDDQIIKGANLLKKYGIKFRTENMVGLPGERLSEMLKTIQLIKKVRPTIGWCSIFQPYPNLPLAEYAKQERYWDGKMNMKESFFETTTLFTLYKKEIINIQRLFGLIVWLNLPLWIVKRMIKVTNNPFFDRIFKWVKRNRYKVLYKQ